MREDVAVIHEVANIHPAKIHQQLHLREGPVGILGVVPERDFDHVQELAVDSRRLRRSVDLEVVLGENLEVDLVHVEFVVLLGGVLNDPLLHRTLRGHDRRRVVVVEQRRLLARAHLGNEELRRLVFAELERAGRRHRGAAHAAKAPLAAAQSRGRGDFVVRAAVDAAAVGQHNVEYGPRRIAIALGARVDVVGDQLRHSHGRSWRLDQEFDAPCNRQPETAHGNQVSGLGAVLRVHRHSVDRCDPERLGNSVIQHLQVEDGICRAVAHPPELRLPGVHMQSGGSEGDGAAGSLMGIDGHIVDADVLERNVDAAVAGALRQPLELRLVADDEHALAQAGDRGLCILDSVHHQCARGAAEKITFGEAVNVRVIPVEPRRFVGREREAVLEGVAGIDQRLGYVVPVALRSHVGAVIVDVHGRTDRIRAGGRRSERDGLVSAIRRIERLPQRGLRGVVGDGDVQGIARLHVQGGVFQTVRRHKAMQ